MRIVQHKGKCIPQVHGAVDRRDVAAVRHDVLRLFIGKFEDVLDHLRLGLLDDSLLMPLVYHGNDLFLVLIRSGRIFAKLSGKVSAQRF